MRINVSELADLPSLSTELLDVLEQLYPLINPEPDTPLRELDRRAGQRDVVEFIQFLKRKGEHPSDYL